MHTRPELSSSSLHTIKPRADPQHRRCRLDCRCRWINSSSRPSCRSQAFSTSLPSFDCSSTARSSIVSQSLFRSGTSRFSLRPGLQRRSSRRHSSEHTPRLQEGPRRSQTTAARQRSVRPLLPKSDQHYPTSQIRADDSNRHQYQVDIRLPPRPKLLLPGHGSSPQEQS